jgi:hypothetical protein
MGVLLAQKGIAANKNRKMHAINLKKKLSVTV